MQLNSIRIVDLTRLLPGPYATQLLSDMGAEVIKIEDPDTGDYARFIEPMAPNDVGAVFSAINRGKKSVTLDLKDDEGRAAFYELIEDADVVFEQFRPGVAERLGIDYETLRERNPDVVYCSLSGYGQEGPYSDRVGHDLNYAGFAGLVDMTRGSTDDDPEIPGYPIGDMAGGTFAALSIVSALLDRELSGGGGNYIDVSMTDAVLSFSQAVSCLALYGDDPRPGETELTGKFPCYDIYRTADDEYVTVAALEPKFWRNLCEALGREDLIDKHRADDEATREAVHDVLSETFASKTRSEWEAELGEKDVMLGIVKSPNEALADRHIESRGIIEGADGPLPRIGYPAQVERGLDDGDETVPEMGEHTNDVLESVGIGEDAIEELRERDVV
ncbi:CaiB/BaiF CoA transferase family protein [Natrinema caseinilyticum]|uniref:CaiB/BaiF CoA transferase family protein n=1 Tax=Natrinema caseinilyticum TaxID=2961570 RepID=UPI0020C58F84|nr:CaiB/BaiF CoA-transferase family protein [Natrinema caseinilyticum]